MLTQIRTEKSRGFVVDMLSPEIDIYFDIYTRACPHRYRDTNTAHRQTH